MKPTIPDIQRWRHPDPKFGGPPGTSTTGAFLIPLTPKTWAAVIATDGDPNNPANGFEESDPPELYDWEHVSVHIKEKSVIEGAPPKNRIPTWEEMCKVKDLFFHPDEVVVQFHPARANYVNHNPNVLHLWRYKKGTFPMPPLIAV